MHNNKFAKIFEKKMEITAVFVIAYLATGIALIGYDFAAPPTYKKEYVSQGKVKGALTTGFFWPATAFMDSYYANKEGKPGMSFATFCFPRIM